MTTGRFTLALAATGVLASESQGLPIGILQSVTVWPNLTLSYPSDTWAMVYIADSVDALDVMSSTLVAGYITRDLPIFWTGLHQVMGSEFMVLQGRSIQALTLTISFGVIHKQWVGTPMTD